MSLHTFTRTFGEGQWDTNIRLLAKQVETDLPGELFTVNADVDVVTFDFEADLSALDITTLVATVETHQSGDQALDDAKRSKNKTIDTHTKELIFKGFEYPIASGQIFSLSVHAQRNLLSSKIERDNGSLAYDLVVPTTNNLIQLNIPNDATFDLFYAEAYTTRKDHLDTGNALKALVFDAENIAAVIAIVDNR